MVECDVRTLQRARHDLQSLGILRLVVATGGRRKTAEFSIDFDKLATVKPRQLRRGFRRQTPTNAPGFLKANHDNCAGVSIDNPGNCAGVSERKPRQSAPERVTNSTEKGDTGVTRSLDPLDPYVQTDAGAPAVTEEAEKETPFRVYAAIATKALDQSMREDKTDELGNVAEHFKTLCAQQKVPYDGEIARKAISATVFARDKAAHGFISRFRTVAGPRRAAGGRA
jgi:hypothetical protein